MKSIYHSAKGQLERVFKRDADAGGLKCPICAEEDDETLKIKTFPKFFRHFQGEHPDMLF
jgi:hypothetical protein